MSATQLVRDYFNREAERFDAIYDDHKPPLQRLIDRLFRGVVRRRLELVCTLGPLRGTWSALDVGCGSGRFGVALARRGAQRVVGVDFAERMIALARARAAARGVTDRCEFRAVDYLDGNGTERFDLVLALGYFDYLRTPHPHLERMLSQCAARLFASFPKRFDFRVPTRILRIRLSGGFVRFYSRAEIVRLLASCGVPPSRFTILDLGRDYLLIVDRLR